MRIDLEKEYPNYYTATDEATLIELQDGKFLTLQGRGAPFSRGFVQHIRALYPMAMAVKKINKVTSDTDFKLCKLECLWWVDGRQDPQTIDKNEWNWKLLMRLPDFISAKLVEKGRMVIKQQMENPLFDDIKYETIHEGEVIQVMHVGSYESQFESIKKILALMEEKNMKINLAGYHHEVYMNDPRDTPSEELMTIVRYPVILK